MPLRAGIRSRSEITAVVNAVAPKPVNVLVGGDFATVAELAHCRRSADQRWRRPGPRSVDRFPQAANEIAERGTFSGLARAVSSAELNGRFVAERRTQ